MYYLLKINLKDQPRSKIGAELIRKTKDLVLSRKKINSNLFYDEINHLTPEMPSASDIKKAFNTLSFYVRGRTKNFTNVQQIGRMCRWISRGSLSKLNKKLFFSSLSLQNDPLLEYLSSIKGSVSNNFPY